MLESEHMVADWTTALRKIGKGTGRTAAAWQVHAQRAMEVGRNPRVVQYEQSFGPSASYYAWEAAGRPVHGVRGRD